MRLGGWCLLYIKLTLWKLLTLLLLEQLTEGLIVLWILEFFALNVVMYGKKVLFEDFLCFCASFLVLQEPSQMLGFIRESREWYFDKFDFKISQFLNFSALFSAIVQFFFTKQNGMLRLQWILFLFITISRNGIWSLVCSTLNCIEGLIEFKVCNNSSGVV